MKYLLYTTLFVSLLACQSTTTQQTAETPEVEEEATTKPVIPPPTKPSTPKQTTDNSQPTTVNPYRDKNWRPEEGNYVFTEAWTWNYLNEEIPPADDRYKGTFTVYIDPPTGTMLLTKADAKYREEMTDWVIIHPDDRYTTAFTDVHGQPHIVEQKVTDLLDHAYRLSILEEDFQKYFTKQAGEKVFGENKYGWETVTGIPYIQTFAGTTDTSYLHLLEMPFPVRGLYSVVYTNPDFNFPLNLGFGYLLPANYLVLSEVYKVGGKEISFELASISPAEYFLNTVTYGVDH